MEFDDADVDNNWEHTGVNPSDTADISLLTDKSSILISITYIYNHRVQLLLDLLFIKSSVWHLLFQGEFLIHFFIISFCVSFLL